MRTKSWRFILVLAMAALFGLGMTVSQAAEIKYLGEVTWTATITEKTEGQTSEEPPFSITVGITQLGASYSGTSYYIVQGTVNLPDDPLVILSGGGRNIGNDLVFSLTGAQDGSNWFGGSILYVKVDKTSFNGSFKVITNEFDKISRGFEPDYVAGDLVTAAPLPSASSTSPLGLLLDQ
jgi:hypothetical protein